MNELDTTVYKLRLAERFYAGILNSELPAVVKTNKLFEVQQELGRLRLLCWALYGGQGD